LYNSTVVLQSLWSEYQLTARAVADVHQAEPHLAIIQSQLHELEQSLTGDNESTSLYGVWNYLIDQLPHFNSSLHALLTEVSLLIRLVLGCVECMRCRLLLPMCAVSVCQSVCHAVQSTRFHCAESFGAAFAKLPWPLVDSPMRCTCLLWRRGCLSVVLTYCAQMTESIIMRPSPNCSPAILVFPHQI